MNIRAARASEVILRERAEGKAEESQERLVRLNVSTGNRLVEQGELQAALWFVSALVLEEGDPGREKVHRQRIGAVLRQAPELSQLWFHEAFIGSAAFSRDGLRVATGSLDRTARVWDLVTGQPVTPPLLHDVEVDSVRFSPDDRWLVTLAQDRRVRVWNPNTGQAGAELPTSGGSQGYDISRDGRYLAGPAGRGRIFDLETGQPTTALLAQDRVHLARFHDQGSLWACASQTANVTEWTTALPHRAASWTPHSTPVRSMVFSPDGSIVATVSPPNIRLWDVRTRQKLADLPLQKGNLYQPTFSPNGRWLATVGFETPTRVWNATNGQPVSPPLLHDGGVQRASFSPDSRWLATASWDRTARVWDVLTGHLALPVIRHAGFVLAAERLSP